MAWTNGMKRLRNLCILMVALPLLGLIVLTAMQLTQPHQYESTAQLLVVRTGSDLLSFYENVGTAEHNSDLIELFVVNGQIPRETMLEFCKTKEENVPHTRDYYAYFFDDRDFAKVSQGVAGGFPLVDEKSCAHLKATYIQGQLTIFDEARDSEGQQIEQP